MEDVDGEGEEESGGYYYQYSVQFQGFSVLHQQHITYSSFSDLQKILWFVMKPHEFRLVSVFSLTSSTPFMLFKEMWMAVFMWCFVSSVFLYSIAAVIAFIILRKHKFGRFYGLMIIIMGTIIPCSLGVLSSAAVAFVYKHSSFSMVPTHAMMWGVGQTVIHAAVGFTRILATL